MRDFSRSVMRHYSASAADEAPSSVPAPRWLTGLRDPIPSLYPSAVQRVSAEPMADSTVSGQPPLLPIDPIAPPTVPPVPEYVPREVFVAGPRSDPPVQRSTDDAAAASDSSGHTLPTHYLGQPIPVDNRPVDPAIKRHMQLTRQREAKVMQNRQQRLEKLLSEVPPPPPPEETATHSGRRIRPRGHIGVEYVQTKALADKREPTDQAPPPAVSEPRREPERGQGAIQREETDDDDETPSAAVADTIDPSSTVQPAIDAAEAPAPPAVRANEPATPVIGVPDAMPAQSAEAPPVQRTVSVDEALAFDEDSPAELPDAPPAEPLSAPVQRASDSAVSAPFDDPAPPVAPSDTQRAADRPDSMTSTVKGGEIAQRAPDLPAGAALPFDPSKTLDEPQVPDAPSEPQAPQFPVQRAPERTDPSPSISGESATRADTPSAPLPSAVQPTPNPQSTPSQQSQAATPPVQREADAASSATVETRPPARQAQARPLAVQRAPDTPDRLPFDPSLAPPVERADNESAVIESAMSLPSSGPTPVSPGAVATPVQRAFDPPPSPPIDDPQTTHDAQANAPTATERAAIQREAVDGGDGELGASADALTPTAIAQRTQTESEALPFDAPSAVQQTRDAPQASPTVPRTPDAPAAVPFEAADSAPVTAAADEPRAVQRSADPAAPPITPADAAPTVPRTPDAPAAVPFEAADSAPATAAADEPRAVQRSADPAAPPMTPAAPAPTVPRTPDAPAAVPFETADSAPATAAADEPRAVQRSADPAAPPATPVDAAPTVPRTPDAPLQRTAHTSAAPGMSAEGAVTERLNTATAAPKPPFGAPPAAPEHPAPAPVQRAADDSSSAGTQADIGAASASMPQPPASTVQRAPDEATPPRAASAAASPVPEQLVYDIPAPGTPEAAPSVAGQPLPDLISALPFDTLSESPAAPAAQPASSPVQRQTDPVDGRVFAVSSPLPAIDRPDAHPIGRPKRANRSATDQSHPVQRAPAQPEAFQPESLPFDPIQRPRPPEPPVQRMPDVPSPANPYAGMDLRQAMIAAGMITPPPTPSASGPLSESAIVQRDLGDIPQRSNSSTETDSQDHASDDDLDVDKLAEDVLHVLRRRLRNEFDRLTGMNR